MAKHTLGEIWKEGSKWKLQAQHAIDTFDTKKRAELFKQAFITGGDPVGACGCKLVRTERGLTMQDCALHAAAPELLEALRSVLPNVPGWESKDFSGRPWLELAKRAIAKAEGK